MLLGNRISLGPIVPADFHALFCWVNDVDAVRFDTAYRPIDFIQHTQWCEAIGKDPSLVMFAIRKLGETAIIGYVKLNNINPVHRCADFAIRIGTEANRSQGYGKEATALGLGFCWDHLNLNRVQLTVFAHNTRAAHVYASAGFQHEGLLRSAAFVNGEWIDLAVMAILRPGEERRSSTPHFTRTSAKAPGAPAKPLVSAA